MYDANRRGFPVDSGQNLRGGQQGGEWALEQWQDLGGWRGAEQMTPLISREHLFQELLPLQECVLSQDLLGGCSQLTHPSSWLL